MNPRPAPPLRNPWLPVALLWFASLINYLDRMTIVTMRTSLREAIPMTDAQFGLLTAAFLAAYAIFNPFCGYLADRFGRSRVITASLFAWSIFTYFTAHARTVNELVATRALMGVSEACYFPAAMALVMDYHRTTTRSFAWGLAASGGTAGLALGGVGGWLAEKYGWTFAFELFGAIGAFYAIVLALFLRDRPAEADFSPTNLLPRASFFQGIGSLLSGRLFLRMLAYFCIMGASLEVVYAWMPTFFGEQSHYHQGKAGLITQFALSLASFPGMLFAGAWGDRWSLSNPRGRNFVVMIGLCLSAVTLALATNMTQVSIVVTSLVVMGFTRGFIEPHTGPILSTVVDQRYLATGMGLLNLVDGVVGGLMIYLTGALRDARVDPRLAFMGAAAGLVVAAAIMGTVAPRTRKFPGARKEAVVQA